MLHSTKFNLFFNRESNANKLILSAPILKLNYEKCINKFHDNSSSENFGKYPENRLCQTWDIIKRYRYISNNWCFRAVPNLFGNILIFIDCDLNKKKKTLLSISSLRFKTKVVVIPSNVCYQPCNREEIIFIILIHFHLKLHATFFTRNQCLEKSDQFFTSGKPIRLMPT